MWKLKNMFNNSENINISKKTIEKINPINYSLEKNIKYLKNIFNDSSDLTIRNIKIQNSKAAIITIEGMIDKEILAVSVMNPFLKLDIQENLSNDKKYEYIRDNVLATSEQMEMQDFNKALDLLMSGFALFLIDGVNKILAIGIQGFSFRSISEPISEVMQKGSREGFVEAIKINITLIRRRIKNPNLKFENMTIGEKSKTAICLC